MLYLSPVTIPSVKKSIEHRIGTVSLNGEIYRLNIHEDVDVELQDAVELVEIGTELTKNLHVGALVDASRNFSITNEARKYFAEKTASQQFRAVAIITNSLAQRLIVNFYININRPNVPTKMFSNETDALEWLNKRLVGKN